MSPGQSYSFFAVLNERNSGETPRHCECFSFSIINLIYSGRGSSLNTIPYYRIWSLIYSPPLFLLFIRSLSRSWFCLDKVNSSDTFGFSYCQIFSSQGIMFVVKNPRIEIDKVSIKYWKFILSPTKERIQNVWEEVGNQFLILRFCYKLKGLSKQPQKQQSASTKEKSIRWSDKFIVIISAIFAIDSGLWWLSSPPSYSYCCCFCKSDGDFRIPVHWLRRLLLQWQFMVLLGCWLAGLFVCHQDQPLERRNAIYDGIFLVHWPREKNILQKAINCTLYCVSIFHNHRLYAIWSGQ